MRSVIFLPGAITSFTDIPITDDPIAEPTENFTLSISIPLQLIGVIPGDPSTATGFIMDDDGMVCFCDNICLLIMDPRNMLLSLLIILCNLFFYLLFLKLFPKIY